MSQRRAFFVWGKFSPYGWHLACTLTSQAPKSYYPLAVVDAANKEQAVREFVEGRGLGDRKPTPEPEVRLQSSFFGGQA